MEPLEVISAEGKVYTFEETKSFVYLGTALTSKPDIKEEIQHRLMAGNRIYSVRHVLKSPLISYH